MFKHVLAKVATILLASTLWSARAQIQTIDLTTLHSNTVSSSGTIWITSLATNKPYTAVQSNALSRGDSPSNAWTKANANFNFLNTQQVANLKWISNSTALKNEPVATIYTNLYPGSSNYLGWVTNFYSGSVVQITNYTPLVLWYEQPSLVGTNPAAAHTFDWGATYWSSGSIPTGVYVWLTAAASSSIATNGQMAWLTVNGSLVYSNYTVNPTLIGLYSNVTSSALSQITNYSAADLWGSYSGTNYWLITPGFSTLDSLYVSLVARTNNPPPSTLTTVTVLSQSNPERIGKTNSFLGEDYHFRNLVLDGTLNGRSVDDLLATNWLTLRSNTWSLFAATNNLNPGDARLISSNTVPIIVTYGGGGIVGYINLTNGGGGTVVTTNIITAYNLSNAMFSSASLTLLDTNFTMSTSNFLGTFTNVLDVRVNPPSLGGGGMTPGTNANIWVWYSTNSGVTWKTNSPSLITNISQVALTVAGTGAGSVTILSAERPELDARINDLTRQRLRVAEPTNNTEAATKYYVDLTTANAVANQWQLGTNGSYFYGPNNIPVLELFKSVMTYSTNAYLTVSGTNWLLNIATTNLATGWQVQMSTNLALLNGFNIFTSYTLSTNTGIVTFTIPKYLTPADLAFFRIVSPQTPGVTLKAPTTFTAGTYYPSNTFDLYSVTNGMANFSTWVGSSNGVLIGVKLSNGVVLYKTVGP